MNKSIFQIDVSKYETEEDIIKIQFHNDDFLQVNFSKLISQSKYIRDKYTYPEAQTSIQGEIEKIKEKYKIKDESIKLFIELIQEKKSNITISHYRDIYTLSEYFCISTFTAELDNIMQKELIKDLNFTIQILFDFENNFFDTKLTGKIENFLTKRINECIENAKFRKLPVSTIYRIINQCKETIDHNLLVDFILESASTRFILFKLVEIHRLKEKKVDEFIKFFDEQNEDKRKMYLEYVPFNLSFIKNMKSKYDQLFKEMSQTKEELKQEKIKHEQTIRKFKQTKTKQEQTNEKVKQDQNKIKQDQESIKEELKHDQTKIKQEQNKIKHDQESIKEETKHAQTKIKQEQKNDKVKQEQTKEEQEKSKKSKNELTRSKTDKKQRAQAIFVAGFDNYNQLGSTPNNKAKNGTTPIISPPSKLPFDPSTLLSYSTYCYHTVLITHDGTLQACGYNDDGRISSTLPKTNIDHFTDFCIKDVNGHSLSPVSAVCCFYGTLYMFSRSNGKVRQLVLCDKYINEGKPVFLDIGKHQPVSLFGGCYHSAAIGSEGEIIFINRYSVKNSPDSKIESVFLPENEKASSVACCDDSVFVLSLNGRVFHSSVDESGNKPLKFSSVSELKENEIICLSGTNSHCLAVSKEGRVFSRGSNDHGQIGLGEDVESVSSFTEIASLGSYEIRSAYAGCIHSLFETKEGKILACGCNNHGELMLNNGPGENVYLPSETKISGHASFCIAGAGLNAVFFGCGPPPNGPNTRMCLQK